MSMNKHIPWTLKKNYLQKLPFGSNAFGGLYSLQVYWLLYEMDHFCLYKLIFFAFNVHWAFRN